MIVSGGTSGSCAAAAPARPRVIAQARRTVTVVLGITGFRPHRENVGFEQFAAGRLRRSSVRSANPPKIRLVINRESRWGTYPLAEQTARSNSDYKVD